MPATFDLGLMFGHLQKARWQLEDLPAFMLQRLLPAQTVPALGTDFQPVNLNVIGIFDPLQSLSGVSGLAPWFAPTGGAQTLGIGFA
jgi:hypothetical protein